MSWIKKAKKVIYTVANINRVEDGNRSFCFYEWEVLDMMKDFAKIACEEQKKICAENAKTTLYDYTEDVPLEEGFDTTLYEHDYGIEIDLNTILNSPTVKFD